MCDPAIDYYCVKPDPEDQGIISFYAANTGLPGPLVRNKPVWEKPVNEPSQGPAMLKHQFRRAEYLDYAFPELKEMRGSHYLRGNNIQKFNVEDMPFDGTHMRRATDPATRMPMEQTPQYLNNAAHGSPYGDRPIMMTPVEKCGCGDPKPGDAKKFAR
jgi:hypothetical protein